MTMYEPKQFHTLHTRSRILSEVIQELDLKELCVTKLVISATKSIESKTESFPIPELQKYATRKKAPAKVHRETKKMKQITHMPLRIQSQILDRLVNLHFAREDGIDLEYVDKVLTNPPYDFPYVRVEEIQGTILKEVPEGTPKTVTFKRTLVKQAQVVSTLKPQKHGGPKYTLELVTTRKQQAVSNLRKLIAVKDPVKVCEPRFVQQIQMYCKAILEPTT